MSVKEQCTEYYIYDKRSMGSIQCRNKAWRDGICKVHHPENHKAREQRAQHRRELRWEERRCAQARVVASPDYANARKQAGLYTLEEAVQALKDRGLL